MAIFLCGDAMSFPAIRTDFNGPYYTIMAILQALHANKREKVLGQPQIRPHQVSHEALTNR